MLAVEAGARDVVVRLQGWGWVRGGGGGGEDRGVCEAEREERRICYAIKRKPIDLSSTSLCESAEIPLGLTERH